MNRLMNHANAKGRGLAFILVAAVIMVPAGMIIYIHIADLRSENVLQNKLAAALVISQGLEDHINEIRDLGITLSLDSKFQDSVRSGNWPVTNQFLEEFMLGVKDPFIDRVFVSDAQGRRQCRCSPAVSASIFLTVTGTKA